MRISRIDTFHVRIPLRSPVETSYERNTHLDKLILKFFCDGDPVWAECTCKPLPYSTSETPATVRAALGEFLLPAVKNREIGDPAELIDLIGPFRGHRMAKATIDNAVWAFTAREAGVSIAEMLAPGGEPPPERVPVGVVVGIEASVDAVLERAERYLEGGFRRLKLKIRPGWDVEVVRAVRERFPDTTVAVDANNAYRWPDDLDTLRELDRLGLQMIEQPLDRDDLRDHAELQARLQTPVCLDESIRGPRTARLAAETGACRVINVKQGRCGGLEASRRIHDIAADAGIGCWAGNMIETGLGQAYSRHLATMPNFVYANDLFPTALFAGADIVEPWSLNPDGTVDVPQGPGLGVEVDPDAVDRYAVAHDVVT